MANDPTVLPEARVKGFDTVVDLGLRPRLIYFAPSALGMQVVSRALLR